MLLLITPVKKNKIMTQIIKSLQEDSRPDGYYKVKCCGSWIVAHWAYGKWLRIGMNYPFYDNEFQEIDENRIVLPD